MQLLQAIYFRGFHLQYRWYSFLMHAFPVSVWDLWGVHPRLEAEQQNKWLLENFCVQLLHTCCVCGTCTAFTPVNTRRDAIHLTEGKMCDLMMFGYFLADLRCLQAIIGFFKTPFGCKSDMLDNYHCTEGTILQSELWRFCVLMLCYFDLMDSLEFWLLEYRRMCYSSTMTYFPPIHV